MRKTGPGPACRLTGLAEPDQHRTVSPDSLGNRTSLPRACRTSLTVPTDSRTLNEACVEGRFRLPVSPDSVVRGRGPSDCGRSSPVHQPSPADLSHLNHLNHLNRHHPSAQTAVWLCSNGEPREQAHIPAQQPSSGQDPWLPPAHAHPRRSRHPGRASSQGSLRTVRLRLDACCLGDIVCEAAPTSPQSSAGHAEQVDLVPAAV